VGGKEKRKPNTQLTTWHSKRELPYLFFIARKGRGEKRVKSRRERGGEGGGETHVEGLSPQDKG